MKKELDLMRSAVLTRQAGLPEPDPAMLEDVINDPGFVRRLEGKPVRRLRRGKLVRRLKRGALDLAAIRDALLVARHRLWADTEHGNAIDDARQEPQADRKARAAEYRRARRALAALLDMMEDVCREPTEKEKRGGVSGPQPDGLKNLGRWRMTGADLQTLRLAVHHGSGFVEALCRVYPALALDYPEIPRAPLLRRDARDTSARIQRQTRAALRATGLPDHLAARLMRAAGIRRS